jgi:uncharacterized membrane protein YhhN
MSLSNKKITIAFLFFTALEIAAIIIDCQTLQYVVKPLLLPTLMLLLYFSTDTNTSGRNFMLTALFFSWLGDIFLMLVDPEGLFFIIGLVCFLTTHIFYIIYFLRIRSAADSLLKKQPLLTLLVIGYGFALVWILFPHLGKMILPVMVYATVICTMLLCSLHVYNKLNKPANDMFVFGALMFVLSDSLLAINKFLEPLPYAGISIMLTYCAAQYFIVSGFIIQHAAHD